jgi:adenylate cyclase
MVTHRVKRKLTAILSADVEGYSLLMADDEAATVATLTAYREVMSSLIHQYSGRVVDAPGDNLLAEFGSVVDAVQCAVEIQRVLKAKNSAIPENRRMAFRIGINLGDVIEEDGRIYGDGVNIAARIESLAEAGGICLSGSAYEHIENKVPLHYEYLGKHTVKNIAKPIRIYKAMLEIETVSPTGRERHSAAKRRRRFASITVLILLLGVGSGLLLHYFYPPPPNDVDVSSETALPFPLPREPSIVVIPFDSLSGDPAEKHAAAAIWENITAVLSKTPPMIVSSRNAAAAYAGKHLTVRQIAEELGVRHVLEGSVLKSGDRLRITVQLIDAITEKQLWTEQYQQEAKDLLSLLDTITQKISLELQVMLTLGEQARRWASGTGQPQAWYLVSRGIDRVFAFTKENNTAARALFEQALEIDPNYAVAMAWLAVTHLLDVSQRWTDPEEHSYRRCLELSQKALAMDDTLPLAHAHLAELQKNRGQYETAIAESRKAIALGPNHGLVQILLANNLAEAGRPDQAIPLFKTAMGLHPYYPAIYLLFLGEAYLRAGRLEEAFQTYETCLKRSRKGELPVYIPLKGLLLSCMESGRVSEAQQHAKELFQLKPSFSLTGLVNVWGIYKQRSRLAVSWKRIREAGIVPPLAETAGEFMYTDAPPFVLEYPVGVTRTQFVVPEKVFEVNADDSMIVFHVFVEDIPTGMRLEDAGPKGFVPSAEKSILLKLTVLSNELTTLQDGTRAYKTKVEYTHRKGYRVTGWITSAFKGNKWIYVAGFTAGDPAEIEQLAESLRFLPQSISIRPYIQHVLPAENVSWTMVDIEIGDDFKGHLPDDIDTITVAGPNGELPLSKKDFYWLPYWRSFWVGTYGAPQKGSYTITVTSGNRSGIGTDRQETVRYLPIPNKDGFTPEDGETLNSRTPTFSWEPVQADGALCYLLEIKDLWGENVYWGEYVEGMLASTVPEGTLAPGKSYRWRVRVADHTDKIMINNIAWSEWRGFTMAPSLE